MYAVGGSYNQSCYIQSNVGFNCSELALRHTAKVSSLYKIVVQGNLSSNSSFILPSNFSFLEYLSTEGLFGTDKNYIHCTLCHRNVEIVEIDSEGKIAYSRNGFHKTICGNFQDYVNNRILTPEYKTFEARLETFSTWPIDKEQTAISLAVAGFFFLNDQDRVKCFSCAGILKNWEKNDKPDEEHALLFPRCEFIHHLKGELFVEAMRLKKRYDVASIAPHLLNPTPALSFPAQFDLSPPDMPDLSPPRALTPPANGDLFVKGMPLEKTYNLMPIAQNLPFPLPPPAMSLPLTPKTRIELSLLEDNDEHKQPIYSCYKSSISREQSFTHDCPDDFYNKWSVSMVEAGFFFFEAPEYVRCFSCGFGVKWSGFYEHPILIHVKLRKGCDYLRSSEGKRIIEKSMKFQRRVAEIFDEAVFDSTRIIRETPAESAEVNRSLLSASIIRKMNKSVYSAYDSFKNRLSLLKVRNYLWHVPKSKLNELAEAGFFHINDANKCGIYCFHCGNRVDGWLYADNVAKEHAYLYPKCGWIAYRNSSIYVVTTKDVEKKTVEKAPRLIYPVFASASYRLKTFIKQWPHSSQRISAQKMAEAGFFFFKIPDTVRCFECALALGLWNHDSVPILDHFRQNDRCRFVNSEVGEAVKDKAFYHQFLSIEEQESQEALSIAIGNEAEIPIVVNDDEELGIDTGSPAVYPAFAFFGAREKSFLSPECPWPHANVDGQDPRSMAKAGFFFDHYKRERCDVTYCFQCGIGLSRWLRSEYPDDEHRKNNAAGCSYHLKRMRLVLQERLEHRSSNQLPNSIAHVSTEEANTFSHIRQASENHENEIGAVSLNLGESRYQFEPSYSTRNQENMGDRERYPASTSQCFVMPSATTIRQSMAAQVVINTGCYTEAEVLDALQFLIQNKQCADIDIMELAAYLFHSKS